MDADLRQRLLEAYASVRVADVRDGMDALGLHHHGSFSPDIRPLWRTRTHGIARTARYVPFAGTVPSCTPEEYQKWSGWYYGNVCTYPWMKEIEEGDFMVIDASGVNAGLMGSENTLGGLRKGCRGYVTSGGVRDTDEIILQKVPFWSKLVSQSMVQGRLQYEAKDVAVTVGGVTVRPGDVIVADGDGVICVPQDAAAQVAELANAEHERDMAMRRKHYEALKMERDETVGDYEPDAG